jgi:hypothetical protein
MEIIRLSVGELGCGLTTFVTGGVPHLWGGSKIHLAGQAFAGSQGGGVIADSMEETPSFRNHGVSETVPRPLPIFVTPSPIFSACSQSGGDVERQKGSLMTSPPNDSFPIQLLPDISPGIVDTHVKALPPDVEGYVAVNMGVHVSSGPTVVGSHMPSPSSSHVTNPMQHAARVGPIQDSPPLLSVMLVGGFEGDDADSQLHVNDSSPTAKSLLASGVDSIPKPTSTRSWKRKARGVTGDSIPIGENLSSPADPLLPLPSIQGSGLKKCKLEDRKNDMLAKAAAESQPHRPQ